MRRPSLDVRAVAYQMNRGDATALGVLLQSIGTTSLFYDSLR
jgi:hypothetical protein